MRAAPFFFSGTVGSGADIVGTAVFTVYNVDLTRFLVYKESYHVYEEDQNMRDAAET